MTATLTHDEILALPEGRDLDALVAERVMGCAVVRCDLGVRCDCPTAESWHDRPHSAHALADCHSRSGLNCDTSELAYYSTDIAAAWNVVGWIGEKGRRLSLADLQGGWRAVVSRYPCDDRPLIVEGSTAPEAICRAALMVTQE